MAEPEIRCDRCKQIIDGAVVESRFSSGVYVIPTMWEDFANPGEQFVCDACMWADPRYVAVYGKNPGTNNFASDAPAPVADPRITIKIPKHILDYGVYPYVITAYVKLRRFAAYMAARFNAPVYLVGSALTRPDPRDIDIRIVISDSQFKARYGQDELSWINDGPGQAWIDDMGHHGEIETCCQQLNIDFQVYSATHALHYKDRPGVVLAAPRRHNSAHP
jgi:hypothetical protein